MIGTIMRVQDVPASETIHFMMWGSDDWNFVELMIPAPELASYAFVEIGEAEITRVWVHYGVELAPFKMHLVELVFDVNEEYPL